MAVNEPTYKYCLYIKTHPKGPLYEWLTSTDITKINMVVKILQANENVTDIRVDRYITTFDKTLTSIKRK